MQLPRLQQLLRALPWHQQQHLPARAASAAARHLAAAATPAPAAPAAQHQAADVVNNEQQQHADDATWRPRRSLPPAGLYSVKVVIKAHDLRFVKAASTVIRDLMLVNFAPKSREVLPPQLRQRSRLPWVQLALPGGDVPLPTRRTHFTVIRGPHVHKSSREQFARTTHKRVVCHATNNLSEMTWFLDSLKLYQFVGVELAIKVSSCSYLLPTTAAEQAAAAQPLLEQHKRRFAHLFGATAGNSSSSGLEQQQEAGDVSYAALQQSLQGLTQTVQDGLLQQRLRLASSPAFQRWRQRLSRGAGSGDAAAAAAAAAAGPAPVQQVLEDAAGQQLQGSGLLAAGEPQQQQQAAATSDEAFRAAVEKALLGLKLDVLDRHKFYPFLMAFYKPGSAVPAAEWMQAVLKYGLHMQQQVEAAQAAAGTQQGLQQLGQVTQAATLLLLQQWHAAADGGTRRQLGMPDVDAAGAMADSSVTGRSKDG